MVQFYPSLSDSLRDWALSQSVFFIASAPQFGAHVNISPKGLPASTFSVLDPNTAAYIDATGSGAETISHVYENGRATVMFCSFDRSPRIIRLFCRGEVVEYDDRERYEKLLERMGKGRVDGARAVILLKIFKVQTSCGYGVPLIGSAAPLEEAAAKTDDTTTETEKSNPAPASAFEDRKTLGHWALQQVEKGVMEQYRVKNNARSLDGLAGLKAARRDRGETLWLNDVETYLRRLRHQWDAILIGMLIAVALMIPSRL